MSEDIIPTAMEGEPKANLTIAKDISSGPDLDTLEQQLLEMKNRSELMLDLAYSALLSNNEELARAVVNFEQWMDKQQFKLQRSALADLASRNIDQVLTIIRLAEALELIGDSARKIADVILRDVEPHPVLRMATDESDATIFQLMVQNDSELAGITVGELRLASETGAWLIAIQEGEDWIIGPKGSTLLNAQARLFAKGTMESRHRLKVLAGYEPEEEQD